MGASRDGEYAERTYRECMSADDLVAFRVRLEQTDLYILAERDLTDEATQSVRIARATLKAWIGQEPAFLTSLRPLACPPDAPRLIREMCAAGTAAGVGPMAAVAGAIAERVARDLAEQSPNVIVENGGDTFLLGCRTRTVSIFAGASPLSHRVGLLIPAARQPISVCTSSGTVGPSLSFGRADAAVIVAPGGALADAAATAVGNRVKVAEDIPQAVEWAAGLQGLTHVVAIMGDRMGAWGELELVKLG